MKITAKLYDWETTAFNGLPIETTNAIFEDKYKTRDIQIGLIYKDGVFAGTAEPLMGRTLEEFEQEYAAIYENAEVQQQIAVNNAASLEAVNAKLDFIIMMEV